MKSGRRTVLKGGMAFLALLGLPRALLGSIWPVQAFESTAASEALISLFGTDQTVASQDVVLTAPTFAENGAIVPVTVKTSLQGVKSISIVVNNNPRPLAASFDLSATTLPDIACRIKMAETSDVVAVVETDGGFFSATANVTVTIGGCA